MKTLSIVLITTFVVLLICLALLNSQLVAVNYIFGRSYIRVSTLFISSFAIGILVGALWSRYKQGKFPKFNKR